MVNFGISTPRSILSCESTAKTGLQYRVYAAIETIQFNHLGIQHQYNLLRDVGSMVSVALQDVRDSEHPRCIGYQRGAGLHHGKELFNKIPMFCVDFIIHTGGLLRNPGIPLPV